MTNHFEVARGLNGVTDKVCQREEGVQTRGEMEAAGAGDTQPALEEGGDGPREQAGEEGAGASTDAETGEGLPLAIDTALPSPAASPAKSNSAPLDTGGVDVEVGEQASRASGVQSAPLSPQKMEVGGGTTTSPSPSPKLGGKRTDDV